jgi:hypothetical protein
MVDKISSFKHEEETNWIDSPHELTEFKKKIAPRVCSSFLRELKSVVSTKQSGDDRMIIENLLGFMG